MKLSKLVMIIFMALGFFGLAALAQVAAPTPVPVPAPLPAQDFFAQVLDVIKHIGGVATLVKISMLLTLLVSSMKVSFLNDLIWSKLGPLKGLVAPALAALAGLLGLGAGGEPISLALVAAYFSAGMGAVSLHELLDAIKSLPGVSPIVSSIVDIISKLLGGPAQKPQ